MFYAHRLTSRRMKIAIPDQLSRPQPATVDHYRAVLECFRQARDRAHSNLTTLRLKLLHQVVEEDACINDGSLKNLAVRIPWRQFLSVGMTKALHRCRPPGVRDWNGLKLQEGGHEDTAFID